MTEVISQRLQAAAIGVIQDSPDLTVLRIELEAEQIEWTVFNPTGKAVEFAGRHAIDPLYTRDSPNRAIRNP